MKFISIIFFCVLTTMGCAKNRGLTSDEDVASHNREVVKAILCGLGGNTTDSSGKCDFTKKSNNSVNFANRKNQDVAAQSLASADSDRSSNGRLVFACGSAGMGVDFVTGNCVSTNGRQVNPRNVVSPSISLPPQTSSDLIRRCGALGQGVDFVNGRCN